MESKLTTTTSNSKWAFFALILGTCALGFAPIFVRLGDTSPISVLFWRMFLSTPLFAAAWILLPKLSQPSNNKNTDITKEDKEVKKGDYLNLFLAGLFFFLDVAIWNYSINGTSVANATLLVNFAPLIAAIISWWFLKQSINRFLVLGMSLAVVGGFLLVYPKFGAEDSSLLGDSLSLIAAVFYALYLIFVQLSRQKFSTLCVMTVSGAITTLFACFTILVNPSDSFTVASLQGWQALWGLAFVQIAGQGLITYALASLPATITGLVLLLQPVVSSLIAWALFNESLVMIQIIGAAVILTGIFLGKIRRASPTPLPAE